MFVSDEPIKKKSDDMLNRGAFVADLGNAILNWDWQQPLVIGIEGEWGTGKTSAINLLSERLREDVIIVRFSPWNWTKSDYLNRTFFAELLDKGNFEKGIKKRIFEYVELLEPFDKRIEIGLGLIKRLFGVKNNSTQSIDSSKSEVKRYIENTEKKFLVFIDDLDRLTPPELLEVFKLVRSNADFSNIVYVLAYQRSIVIKHLDKEFFPGNSDKYLEKIIQFPINLPEIDRSIIYSILENEITSIIGSREIDASNQSRLSELFYFYLLDKIHNLRDVKRYTSYVKFSFTMHQNEDELEVNLVDLLALCAIKIFSPVTYDDIYKHRNLLLGEELIVSEVDFGIASERAKKITEGKATKRIMEFLFPDIENIVEAKKESYRYGNGEEAFIAKRICHSKLFDRYFQMHIPIGDVSFKKMKTFIFDLNNNYKLLEKYDNDSDLEKLTLRIKYFLNESILYGSNTLYTNLLKLGDVSSDKSEGLLVRSPFSNICYCLTKVLIREMSSESDRADTLLSAYHGSKSFAVIARILNSEWWARQEEKKGQESFLGGQGLKRLKEAWLEDLADMSIKKPCILLEIPALPILLIQWEKEAGDAARIKKWIQEIPHEKETFFNLLEAYSRNTSRGPRVNIKELYRYLKPTVSNLQNLCIDEPLSPDQEILYKAYKISIRETQHGLKELES